MVELQVIEKDTTSPWLLFIHGFGGSTNMWKRQVEHLKDRFNICLVNLPGHNGMKLTKEELKSENIFKDTAKEIISKLKEMGIKKITTISVSLGTLVNYFMLKEDNELIDKAILSGAVCGITNTYRKLMNLLIIFRNFLSSKMLMSLSANVLMPMKAHRKSRKFLLQECKKMKKEEFLFWFKNITSKIETIKDGMLTAIERQKMYIVSGDEDVVFFKKMREFAEKHGIPLKVIKDCGHVCSLQKWRDFNDYLDTILPSTC